MTLTANKGAPSTEALVVIDGLRTPMAEYCGSFADVSAIELGGLVLGELRRRLDLAPADVDHVVFGNALQTSGDAIYGARHVALQAGFAVDVPALTVNRLCGSGIQAIVTAAHLLQLGEAATVAAGGMENMTQAPHVIRGARRGFRLGEGSLEDSLMVALLDSWCGLNMAQTAEKLAREHGISREAQDEYALRSQEAAAAAQSAGHLAEEIHPVTVGSGSRKRVMSVDDHPRPDSTLEGLASLRPAFERGGCVTAGNASGIVDGAAAVVVSSESRARERGWEPLGRLLGWCVAGVEPSTMGIGPVPAVAGALEAAGLALGQVDLLEINEAFAAQYLAVEKLLGLERGRVNVNGGAIALGHPLAATGTRLVVTLLKALRRRGGGRGVASACIGGGQGIALVVETC